MADTKYTCGELFPSGCVVYTGYLPNFIKEEEVGCTPSLDEILERFGKKIECILSDIDLTELNKGCLDFDPATVQLNELEQIQLDKICEHETEITAIQDELDNLDIPAQPIEIDLGCLADDASPCEAGSDTYTLISILLTFKNAICDLRSQVTDCCLSGGNSGTSGTSGANGTSGSSGTSGGNGGNGTSGASTTSGSSGTSGTSGTNGEASS